MPVASPRSASCDSATVARRIQRGASGRVVQGAVLDADGVRLVAVGDAQRELEAHSGGALAVEADRHVVEQHLGGHRARDVGRGARPLAELRHAVAQLLRRRQVEVAPRPGLGLVAELLERVGLQQPARLDVLRVGEHEVVHDLGHPAVLAARRSSSRALRSTSSAPPVSST